MQTNWAEENLQTIRTLMERSAVYRRALAPIVLFAGIMGIVAAAIGLIFNLDSAGQFEALWLATAAVVVTGAFLNTRRQAIRDGEPLWSPPTRRVAQALLPPLTVGFVLGIMILPDPAKIIDDVTLMWAIFYGCALHSAGFFVARGLKWFGWLYILLTIGTILFIWASNHTIRDINPNLLMGFFFGVLHLVYGAYLFLTEKGKNAA